MSDVDARRAEALILELLRTAVEPLSTHELFRRLRERGNVASDAVSYAAWDLVEQGRAEFTPDRRLRARN